MKSLTPASQNAGEAAPPNRGATSDQPSLLALLQSDAPELLELLQALKAQGGAPRLVALTIGGRVLRDAAG